MRIYIDGSGWNRRESKAAIVTESGKEEIIRLKEKRTNNEMEYLALIIALEKYAKDGDEILCDSQLVVNQLLKGWKINYLHLRELNAKAKKLLEKKKVKLIWIPREENKAGILIEKRGKDGKK